MGVCLEVKGAALKNLAYYVSVRFSRSEEILIAHKAWALSASPLPTGWHLTPPKETQSLVITDFLWVLNVADPTKTSFVAEALSFPH